jgi:acetylornithine/succinyldiaminopimelate/putrescine aminotransferase
MGGIIRNLAGQALIVNGIVDHVHLLVWLPPTVAVAEALRVLKANSSRWVHDTQGHRTFAWQASYGAFSVSHSNTSVVVKYIQEQEEHHRRISFQEEFLTLLNFEFQKLYTIFYINTTRAELESRYQVHS